MPLSGDPEARSRQLANLTPATGAPAGNGRAVTHGAFADVPEPELRAKAEEIAAVVPVREHGTVPAADRIIVLELAKALIRRDRVRAWLDERERLTDRGALQALEQETRLSRLISQLAGELGMTPRSRAALGVDLVRAVTAGDRLSEHIQKRYGGGDG